MKHEGILAFGCGCNKARSNGVLATPRAVRQTVYQVVENGGIKAEFGTLREARQAANAEGGSVRVSSKVVN